jgi:hypothetical protein
MRNYSVAIDYLATMGQQSWPGSWQGHVKANSKAAAIEAAIHQLRVEHVERLTIKGTSAQVNGWSA